MWVSELKWVSNSLSTLIVAFTSPHSVWKPIFGEFFLCQRARIITFIHEAATAFKIAVDSHNKWKLVWEIRVLDLKCHLSLASTERCAVCLFLDRLYENYIKRSLNRDFSYIKQWSLNSMKGLVISVSICHISLVSNDTIISFSIQQCFLIYYQLHSRDILKCYVPFVSMLSRPPGNWIAAPKPPNLTGAELSPVANRAQAGRTSRCKISFSWQYRKASSICRI